MRKLLVLLMISMSLQTLAQTPGGTPSRRGPSVTGTFYGRVVDAANKGVEAASVTLVQDQMDTATKKRKEAIVGGMLTKNNGDFTVDNIPLMGRYTLRITAIGYKPYEQKVAFDMPNRNAGQRDQSAMLGALDKDLGNIKLAIDDKVLSSVTVTAYKPLVQLGVDRKIFNVDKNIVSAGGSAVDVMKNVPSVNVDIDGNVTLRNNAPQIFVDGRPTNLTLEQIPADAIESVEIITNPSAKFDASGGTAGILNIVLKKAKRVGYSGNVRANVDSRGRVGGGGDINVRQNKINFFASGMYNQRKSNGTGLTDRLSTFGKNTSHTVQSDRSVMSGAFGFGRAGIDYFIDNRNTLTLSGTMARGTMKPNSTSKIYTDIQNDNLDDSLQERFSNSTNQFRNYGAQLSYKHIFPKAGREWTADVTYNKGKNQNQNDIQADYYSIAKVFDRTYRQMQVGGGNNDNLIVQTDYVNPINDKSKVEFGARLSARSIESETNYYLVDAAGKAMPNPNQANILYNSKDNVYAAYATYTNRIKDFGYQVGLRAESSNYEGILPNKAQTFTIDFPISLFPSVFLSQKLSENDDLQLNYSRRINRPNFWQLFPFTDYSDSLNISRGNPNLQPEFTNSLELSYSKVFKNRDNFIASIYFKNTNHLITRYQNVELDPYFKDSVIVNSFINANSSYVTGLELIGKNKITKWWDITSNLNLFTAKIDLDSLPSPDQFPSYFVKINNTFRLPKNFSIQLSGDYQSKIISAPGGSNSGGGGRGGGMFGGPSSAAQGFIRPNYGVDAAIRFDFLKNNAASLSLNVNDILKTRRFRSYTESPFLVQDAWRRRDYQVFRLNFNYRFGKFDASLFKRKNNRAENMNNGMEGTGF